MAQVELPVLFGWWLQEAVCQPNRMGSMVHVNSQAFGDAENFFCWFLHLIKSTFLFSKGTFFFFFWKISSMKVLLGFCFENKKDIIL
jgi:hypothetical protein